MNPRLRNLLVLVAILSGLATVLMARPAQATTTPDYTDDRLLTELPVTEKLHFDPLLRLPVRHMTAGQSVLLTARLAGTTDAPRTPLMEQSIWVADSTGAVVWNAPNAGINHDGAAAGVEYVSDYGLFTAPATGDYTITMMAGAATALDPENVRFWVEAGATYLKASAANPGAIEWREAADDCVGGAPIPSIPQCSTARTSTAALNKVIYTVSGSSATVVLNLGLSREYGSYPGGTSVYKVRIGATPASSTGQGCSPQVWEEIQKSTTSNRHHDRAVITLTGIPTTCGPQLRINATVTWISGNPVTIEGERYSNAIYLPSGTAPAAIKKTFPRR